MTPAPSTVRPTAKVADAVRLMRAAKIRHLPVVDANKRLVGIVTDRDLRQVILDPRLQERLGGGLADALEGLTVRDIMTWTVFTVRRKPRSAMCLPPFTGRSARPGREERAVGGIRPRPTSFGFAEVPEEGVWYFRTDGGRLGASAALEC
jgi:CBS domain-containing protein